MTDQPRPATRSQIGLDWLNFFVADVETGFGPFIAIYLTQHGWSQGTIGSILTVSSAVGLVTRTPAGALIDSTTRKRLVVVGCILLIAAGALLIALAPSYLVVMAAEIMHGVAGGTVQTALVAMALGLVGHRTFHTRVGRNHRWKSLGNALTAGGMGVLGHFFSSRAPFFVAAGLCVPALAAVSFIRGRDIDDARARSSEGRKEKKPATWRQLFANRRLLVLAVCLFLFQFANASILPLASERLASRGGHESELVTAALVVVPQLVTAALAGWIARKADSWGRKALLLAGFATLPIRAGLFALGLPAWYLVGFQVLGGFTAAVVGILVPLVVADVTRRSGRYNVALGAANTVGAVGAALSTTVVGFLAQTFGLTVGFACLAVVGCGGLGLLAWKLPDTMYEAKRED